MKVAAIIISGAPAGDNLREVEIERGTNAGDILRSLNLNGYLLSREGSAQAFAAEEDIYSTISDGDKLRATPIAEVGAGFWQALVQLWKNLMGALKHNVSVPPSQDFVKVRRITKSIKTPTKQMRVERDRRTLWEVRGWKRDGDRLQGAFRTPRGSFVGEISLHRPHPEFFILNPPGGLLHGAHGACFRSRGDGKFFVHFGRSSPDVDAGIVAIERLIAESLTRKPR